MHGVTVGDLSRGMSAKTGQVMGGIYALLFSLTGGCLYILALREGRAAALRFVGAIATAYYLALIAFYFIPATGPYYLSILAHDGHFVRPDQISFVTMLQSMPAGIRPTVIGTDYFIALPSLHMVQPLIAIWMTRKWKPIAVFLAVFAIVQIPAILLLQEHYVVDLIAGFPFAAAAIWIVNRAPDGRKEVPATSSEP